MDPFQESAERRRELAGLMIRRLIGHALGLQLRWQHTTEPVFIETASPKEITARAEPKCPRSAPRRPAAGCAGGVSGLRAALPRGRRASGHNRDGGRCRAVAVGAR